MQKSREQYGQYDVRVWSGGSGAPVLYLHGWEQHPGDAPFLNRLAQTRAVKAPEHPGYGVSTGIENVVDVVDVALFYRRLIEAWGVGPVDIIGHDLGGMLAAEIAAVAPHLVKKLVLVSPYGLWLDEAPMIDPFTAQPPALAEAKWANVELAGAEPSAFDAADGFNPGTFRMTNLAAATKFLWPIPDRGLSRRIAYVDAPTLVVRGEADGLVPAPYVDAWVKALPGARAVSVPAAGHLPMVEAEDKFIEIVDGFLG